MRLLRQGDAVDPAPAGSVAPRAFRPRPWQEWAIRGLLAAVQLALIGLAAWLAGQIPMPLLENWLPVKHVLIAIVAVTAGGKCLIDTLFFDRYWP